MLINFMFTEIELEASILVSQRTGWISLQLHGNSIIEYLYLLLVLTINPCLSMQLFIKVYHTLIRV
jgi:hypothetical protein